MNSIEWKKKAVKQLQKIPQEDRKVIFHTIGFLKDFPDVPNVKRLVNHKYYEYRLRIGNYRVLFNYVQIVQIISIEEVKKRDERTY